MQVCHVPPGNAGNAQLSTIGESALPAHLAHGDDITRPQAQAALLAQLLAFRLNVQRAAAFGEDLLATYVYGRDESVLEIVDRADAAVVSSSELCSVDQDAVQQMRWLTDVLAAINAGGITFLRRPLLFAPVQRPSLRTLSLSGLSQLKSQPGGSHQGY